MVGLFVLFFSADVPLQSSAARFICGELKTKIIMNIKNNAFDGKQILLLRGVITFIEMITKIYVINTQGSIYFF